MEYIKDPYNAGIAYLRNKYGSTPEGSYNKPDIDNWPIEDQEVSLLLHQYHSGREPQKELANALVRLGVIIDASRVTPENIQVLQENEIFVFGSNLSGAHGAGAAKQAKLSFGAIYGQAEGLQGSSYAIPTKTERAAATMELKDIAPYVERFTKFAKENPDKVFLVTEIGCGLAGLTPEQVAPMFKDCKDIENVTLPERFWNVLNKFDN